MREAGWQSGMEKAAFIKRRTEKEIERDRLKDRRLAGAVAAPTAVYMGYQVAKPMVTGRSDYYHGTSDRFADSIHKSGIKPASKTGKRSVTQKKGPRSHWGEKAYATKERRGAKWYAEAAQHQHGGKKKVLKISIPEWKKGAPTSHPSPKEVELKTGKLPERAFGNIGPKYIKGSGKYKKLSMGEVKEYAKKHPGRFAAGVGVGALGLGAGALAARAAYRAHKKLKKQKEEEKGK